MLAGALCFIAPSVVAQSPPATAASPVNDAGPATSPQQSNGAALPTIQVTAHHAKAHVARARPIPTATARPAPSPAPPSPYVTGARNIAGGAPVVPTLASQMTVSGRDLNARPITRPGEIVEAAPGLTAIGSPKFRMVIGPFANTELFVGAGMGYHSNDARSTTVTEVPGDPTTPEGGSPFLVRARGAEIGLRSKAVPGLDSSVSVFTLHQDSELFFSGDTGDTTPGRPSLRTGIEITNDYRPVPWAHIDADLALSRARFLGYDVAQGLLYQSLAGYPQAQIGNAPGNFVDNAPWMVASAGVTLGNDTGWFGALRWRYISARPLTEDGAFQSPPFSVVNAQLGYRFANGWRIQLDGLNLLNSRTDQATYAYGSLLKTDSLFAMCFPVPTVPAAVCQNGVMDYVLHPIEPLAVRLTVAATF